MTAQRWRHAVGPATIGLLALLVVAAALAGAAVFRTKPIRCYRLEPPLSRTERLILAGGVLDCLYQQCRLAVRVHHGLGLACFFPRAVPPPPFAPLGPQGESIDDSGPRASA